MENYHKSQLKKLNTNSNLIKVKFSDGDNQTNYLTINRTLAQGLVEWLEETFLSNK